MVGRASRDSIADELLGRLGRRGAPILGEGGEAVVYALDDERILRLDRSPGSRGSTTQRVTLLDELSGTRSVRSVRIPEVLEHGELDGRGWTVERRFRGRAAADELLRLDRPGRDALVRGSLDAIAALGDLPLEPRPWFGDLRGTDPIRAGSWREFLVERVRPSVRSVPALVDIDVAGIADDVADLSDGEPEPSFVHLDAFLGNVLADGPTVTAVIDIGWSSIAGEHRLDPVSAVVYLDSPEISPTAVDGDRSVAHDWLDEAGLRDWYAPTGRWLAAFWAFAVEDQPLHRWCRRILLDG